MLVGFGAHEKIEEVVFVGRLAWKSVQSIIDHHLTTKGAIIGDLLRSPPESFYFGSPRFRILAMRAILLRL